MLHYLNGQCLVQEGTLRGQEGTLRDQNGGQEPQITVGGQEHTFLAGGKEFLGGGKEFLGGGHSPHLHENLKPAHTDILVNRRVRLKNYLLNFVYVII